MNRSGRFVRLAFASVLVVNAGAARLGAFSTLPKIQGQLVTDPAACPGTTSADYDAGADPYSLYKQLRGVQADSFYQQGHFGQLPDGSPIGIAMIDSGVAPVQGIDPSNVVDGPDLSFESQAPYATGPGSAPNTDLPHNDTFGHGTHMAGILVGRDDANGSNANGHVPYSWNDPTKFTGVAPGARVISLKVADASGAVDISQVIAAVDWVVQHRNDAGLKIRVLNLSYGVYASDSAHSNALTDAFDAAWKAGIVVVAAAGNAGNSGTHSTLPAPAYDPRIIAVGAFDNMGTPNNIADDQTADFTTKDSIRPPDVVAPGAHVLSLHAVGSQADAEIAAACQAALASGTAWRAPFFGPGARFVRGSGTSQAAAIVSGGVALLLSQRPELTPDQVKAILRATTTTYSGDQSIRVMGKGGELWLGGANVWPVPSFTPSAFTVNGGGSLNDGRGASTLPCLTTDSIRALRGTAVPNTLPKQWQGGICSAIANAYPTLGAQQAFVERDVRGQPFNSAAHALQEAAGATWQMTPSGEMWNGAVWSGVGWTYSALLGRFVRGTAPWVGGDWLSHLWTSHMWTSHHWTGHQWTGHQWTDASWLGHQWTDSSWADNSWS